MILLDTDHISILQIVASQRRTQLVARMALAVDETFGITIVSVEEQMRGWLATIAKERQIDRQVKPYYELGRLFEFFQSFVVQPFDRTAASRFSEFRSAKVRLATMDLKIASIAIANDSLLLTANKRDFEKVPGLRFESWLE